MKRSVEIDPKLSDYARAEFFNFLFILFFQKAKLKNLAVFANTHEPLGKPVIAMFYIRCVCPVWASLPYRNIRIYLEGVLPERIKLSFRREVPYVLE